MLVKLQEVVSNRWLRLCLDLVLSAICLARSRPDVASLVYLMNRDVFSVLSFGFADQNLILWSLVQFGGLGSRSLGVGRELFSLYASWPRKCAGLNFFKSVRAN
ncbi:unnamed protein product [Microthlaspi erraticum]|uniref:Uncharacterized protein n=1 Tax=Microthlaspi erraticum TaxID=1685480 RepID=A0A6D2IM29_9BRAS|nr:unnamed protein product [Microthlaspi erraticum]